MMDGGAGDVLEHVENNIDPAAAADRVSSRRNRAAGRGRVARPSSGPDKKRVVVALILLTLPLAAGLWFFVLKDRELSPMRSGGLDPYAADTDPNAGLMVASGPRREEAEPETAGLVAARSRTEQPQEEKKVEKEAKAPQDSVVSGLLETALRVKDELAAENSRLAAEVAALKSDLTASKNELRLTKAANDRQVATLESQIRKINANMQAEIAKARADALNGIQVEPGMTEEERDRLRELRELERRRLRKSGVVVDEAPKEGN